MHSFAEKQEEKQKPQAPYLPPGYFNILWLTKAVQIQCAWALHKAHDHFVVTDKYLEHNLCTINIVPVLTMFVEQPLTELLVLYNM